MPDDPSEPTYIGHFAFRDGYNFNRTIQISPNFTTKHPSTGSDGSTIRCGSVGATCA